MIQIDLKTGKPFVSYLWMTWIMTGRIVGQIKQVKSEKGLLKNESKCRPFQERRDIARACPHTRAKAFGSVIIRSRESNF